MNSQTTVYVSTELLSKPDRIHTIKRNTSHYYGMYAPPEVC